MSRVQLIRWLNGVLIGFLCCSLYADPVELTLEDGSNWVGETGVSVTVETLEGDETHTYEGELTRATATFIIVDGEFISISTITTITSADDSPSKTLADKIEGDSQVVQQTESKGTKEPAVEGDLPTGVFVLPLKQSVGTYFRDTEVTQLVEYIEKKYGLGQIIVLEINSGGGAVSIWDKIRDVVFEARERHRFIAWIESAGSGAASTTFLCDEIYFKSYANVGSITMYSGSIENAAPDWQMDGWVRELAMVLAHSSHTPMIAGCMVREKYNFSYDIDPETGVITYYHDEFGDHQLSTSGENLMLSAGEAEHCGISDGTADTGEELAVFLDLDEWIEIDTYGRDIAKKWTETIDEFEDVRRDLFQEFQEGETGNTQKQVLLNRIRAGEEILRWYKKLGYDTFGGLVRLDPEQVIKGVKKGIKEYKHQIMLLGLYGD